PPVALTLTMPAPEVPSTVEPAPPRGTQHVATRGADPIRHHQARLDGLPGFDEGRQLTRVRMAALDDVDVEDDAVNRQAPCRRRDVHPRGPARLDQLPPDRCT
ncbi:MAG TPA: hypothetical protein PLC03_12950, partial [Microthrixaceae bacterium]|nr:hypothetical protein [Microthrixaceae bacterium]